MKNSREDRIDKLIGAQRPDWSLDQPFYQDSVIFERECERLYRNQWIMAGHISQIPAQGDYFLFAMAGESIIVMRGPEGAVRAFYNVCRHRGSTILSEDCGHAKSLVCPYHGWSYAQDGSLRKAPRMPADFDPTQFALKICPSTVIEGLIFICLTSGEAPDLGEVGGKLAPFLQLHGTSHAVTAHREIFSVEANWKLVLENYLECYHCKPAHKEYCCIEIKAEKIGDGAQAAVAAWDKRFAEWRDLAGRMGTWLDDFAMPFAQRQRPAEFQCSAAYRAPLRTAYLTGSQDGKPVAPLMGDFTEYDGGETALAVGPFTFMLAYNDYVTFFQFVPVDAGHCDMIVSWLVHPEAAEVPEFDLERLTWLWTVTSEQDKAIIEANAKGIGSRAYEPGPVSLLEADVAGFRRWYLAAIGPDCLDGTQGGSGRYFGF
jgi:phenylpropionate dioxygenase-like ring-hydroxylating dioxygenase large terminal subunit